MLTSLVPYPLRFDKGLQSGMRRFGWANLLFSIYAWAIARQSSLSCGSGGGNEKAIRGSRACRRQRERLRLMTESRAPRARLPSPSKHVWEPHQPADPSITEHLFQQLLPSKVHPLTCGPTSTAHLRN
ncbi:unnamed protein product [Leuciscus chuanchicus]